MVDVIGIGCKNKNIPNIPPYNPVPKMIEKAFSGLKHSAKKLSGVRGSAKNKRGNG